MNGGGSLAPSLQGMAPSLSGSGQPFESVSPSVLVSGGVGPSVQPSLGSLSAPSHQAPISHNPAPPSDFISHTYSSVPSCVPSVVPSISFAIGRDIGFLKPSAVPSSQPTADTQNGKIASTKSGGASGFSMSYILIIAIIIGICLLLVCGYCCYSYCVGARYNLKKRRSSITALEIGDLEERGRPYWGVLESDASAPPHGAQSPQTWMETIRAQLAGPSKRINVLPSVRLDDSFGFNLEEGDEDLSHRSIAFQRSVLNTTKKSTFAVAPLNGGEALSNSASKPRPPNFFSLNTSTSFSFLKEKGSDDISPRRRVSQILSSTIQEAIAPSKKDNEEGGALHGSGSIFKSFRGSKINPQGALQANETSLRNTVEVDRIAPGITVFF